VGWFSSKKDDKVINIPDQMSPIEAVTHLCAAIQISDGQVDYEEKKSWAIMVKNLFPDHSDERADRFLNEAFIVLNQKTNSERTEYTRGVLRRIKSFLDKNQLKQLSRDVSNLIESDGIVMNSEIELANLIKSEIGITIKLKKDI
jgi:hypothetical protein